MELRDALTQISEIRLQLARNEVFRGYRAMPVAFSGGIAILAAFIQSVTIPDPVARVGPYLVLWIGAAVVSALAAGPGNDDPGPKFEQPHDARANVAGSRAVLPILDGRRLLTVVIVRAAPESLWMLPGLWQIVYCLGIFASCRLLPRPTFWVGVFYLGTGLAVVALGSGDSALSPWSMGLPYGVGQMLAALVLYCTLEREHA